MKDSSGGGYPPLFILNFGWKMNEDMLESIERIFGQKISDLIVIDIPIKLGNNYYEEIENVINKIPDRIWLESGQVAVLPPQQILVAVGVIAALRKRLGYYPPILRVQFDRKWEVVDLIYLELIK